MKKPNVYSYHDYREYLNDWVAFKKNTDTSYSLRRLAQASGISASLLSMVFNGERALTEGTLTKIAKAFRMNKSEISFLRKLVVLAETSSQDERIAALRDIQRFKSYQGFNPGEFKAFKYLTKWYYVAIRELASSAKFQLDPAWIQSQLWPDLKEREIQEALDFLFAEKFLDWDSNQNIVVTEKQLDCFGGVYRASLAQFHKQAFNLAIESIEKVPREKRLILGHTLMMSPDAFRKVQKVLEQSLKEIQEIEKEDSEHLTKKLFHIGLTSFSLGKEKE